MADETGTKPGGDGGDAKADTGPMLARTGLPSPFGTLTEDVKTKVDMDTLLLFQRWCVENGTSPSGHLRNEIYKRVHGETYDEAVSHDAKRRARELFREGTFEAPGARA